MIGKFDYLLTRFDVCGGQNGYEIGHGVEVLAQVQANGSRTVMHTWQTVSY